MTGEAVRIELPPLTGPQISICRIHERPERCWDIEGAPRSAKSWGVGFWIWLLAYLYPGIHIFYCRYKDDDLKTLREVWGKVSAKFPDYLQPTWNAKEEAWDFPNGEWRGTPGEGVYSGSRVYLSSLRVAEAQTSDAVHGKYKGKTLAVIVVEEAQEVPLVNYKGLKERLSQSTDDFGVPRAYPLKIVLVHNAIDEDHWIAEEYPLAGETCTKPDHVHIRADLFSNAANLGQAVVAGFELDHPVGSAQRSTVIEGRRGLTQVGHPVYESYFDRLVHVSHAVQRNPRYPVLVGWDFGHEKPAVVFAQYITHLGAFQILGAVKGIRLFLEDFAPKVLEIQRRWFPDPVETWAWSDPTGATGNQGTRLTAVRLLQDLGVTVRYEPTANRDTVRYAAIQTIAGFMRRKARDRQPAFQMHPRCVEVSLVNGALVEQDTDLMVKAFAAGYIWADRAASDANPNIRHPQKGTRYDDLMNACEYIVTGEQISVPLEAEMLRAHERQLLVAQRQAVDLEHKIFDRAGVGPAGETLIQATTRIAAEHKRLRDHDRSDARHGKQPRRGRGGW